jgi:hypothetical protein
MAQKQLHLARDSIAPCRCAAERTGATFPADSSRNHCGGGSPLSNGFAFRWGLPANVRASLVDGKEVASNKMALIAADPPVGRELRRRRQHREVLFRFIGTPEELTLAIEACCSRLSERRD